MKYYLFFCFSFLFEFFLFSQEVEEENVVIKDSIPVDIYQDMAFKPTKVTFYSAILPGLGQAYNKDYWKIPIIYGALGTALYSYDFNNDRYKKYRKAYKLLKLGLENDYPNVSEKTLESFQKYHKKYRDVSIIVTSGLYLLQIVEASVDAHLKYHNTTPELTIRPYTKESEYDGINVVGMKFTFNF